MQLEAQGKLITKYDTQVVNDRFQKREFVIEIEEEINGNTYTNYGKFQLVQTRCDLLNPYAIGDMILVKFNIKGNKWEKDGKVNYMTNLDVWRIEGVTQTYTPLPPEDAYPALSTEDNLPF